MKKILLLAIVAMSSIAFAVAQPRAIGVNLGYGIDLSYQQAIGDANMMIFLLTFLCLMVSVLPLLSIGLTHLVQLFLGTIKVNGIGVLV